MVTRREFLKLSALAGVGLAVPWNLLAETQAVSASTNKTRAQISPLFARSGGLKKFIQPLRMVGPDIPIARPDSVNPGWWQPGVTHYTIDVGQFTDQLHPDLPNPTRLRGFGQNGSFKHLGGVIAAKRGSPVQVTFRNNLPLPHILPVDRTIMGAEDPRLDNRVDVHLHGGFVPWVSDGGPFAWWNPLGKQGPSFVDALNPHPARNEAEYYYPNQQGARLMWYHDHVIGLTRLNAYAGIATGYVIYDDYELSLAVKNNLPGPLDARTMYMIFQDKIFVSDQTAVADPDWFDIVQDSRPGDLWYAHEYDPDRWNVGPAGTPPAVSCIPEFFGDTILVNGTVYPYLEVEPRQYRFRLLNACQARFLNPRLVYAQGADFPANTAPNLKCAGPAFIQIGTEGGFLPMPVMLNGPKQHGLLLAPAERADLIVDFRDVPPGSTLILYNDAPAPFPMGDAVNDYDAASAPGTPGYGPDSRTLLQIRVKSRVGKADAPVTLPGKLTPTDPFIVTQNPGSPTPVPAGVPVRRLTLNETFDEYGRLIQTLGTDQSTGTDATGDPLFGRGYMTPPTENVSAGATEVWEVVNLTGDTHPIHFHLVNVQVLSRQPFDADHYTGGVPTYTGSEIAPDNNELGWKETVRMNPEQVTRVIMRFNLPSVPFNVPPSPRTGGNEYVWHCHILEHEEHDMMRPLIVT